MAPRQSPGATVQQPEDVVPPLGHSEELMARIVMTAIDSYGDVYPFLSLGCRLGERGHEAILAAPEACTGRPRRTPGSSSCRSASCGASSD